MRFIAHPAEAPTSAQYAHARPDDVSENGRTWRERLLDHNANGNPVKLLPAYRLYAHEIYRALVERFGIDQVFILSAGWGLIPAGFGTPCTTSRSRRRPSRGTGDADAIGMTTSA